MVSVVIPTYNEASYLPATLDSVADSKANKEVIVVDVGSVDGTAELAREKASRVVLSRRRQRADQMNLGARLARGSILLFLHADTVLPASRSIISNRLYRGIESSAADLYECMIQARGSCRQRVYLLASAQDGQDGFSATRRYLSVGRHLRT